MKSKCIIILFMFKQQKSKNSIISNHYKNWIDNAKVGQNLNSQFSLMHHNYHKRLVNYLSEPQYTSRRAQSQTSYINAANSKYYNAIKQNNYKPNDMFYSTYQNSAVPVCPQCQAPTSRNSGSRPFQNTHQYQCNAFHTNQKHADPGLAANQYFGPEIKTIRNTLIDIRDQMKNKPKKHINQQNTRRFTQQSDTQIYQKIRKGEQQKLRSKYAQKDSRNRQLMEKIQELEQINQRLNRQNNQLKQDLRNWQNKMKDYQIQIQQQRGRANRAQAEKNQTQQRQRSLQLKIMDLRAQLMRNEQILRELNFNEEQQRRKQTTKRLMLGPSQEFNVTVDWRKQGSKQSRYSQTHLTQVDIESGYKQLNQMQDSLCDKINGNLKVEKKIFARIAQIDDKLSFAYDKLYRLQDDALRLGINF